MPDLPPRVTEEQNPRPARGPSERAIRLWMGLLCLIWGSTWLVIRGGLRDLPPFTSAGVRFLVAFLVMLALAPRLARREGGRRPGLGLTLAMGTLNFGVSYGIVYWSETILPSGLVSVLWSVFPLMMAVSGHFTLPNERLHPKQWGGFVFAFLGVLLLFATDIRALGPAAIPAGLVLLLSPAVSTVGTTLVKKYGEGVSSVLLNRNGMLVGAVMLLACAGLMESGADVHWTARAIASVAYLAVFGTVVTFGIYFWLMRFAPAYQLSLIAFIIPAIALTLGAAVGGEPVGTNTIGGTAAILVGVAFVLGGKRRG